VSTQHDAEWITVAEAAAILADVHPSVAYRLFHRGEIVGTKVAGRVKLRRDSVEAYLAAHSNEKPPPSEEEALQQRAESLSRQQQSPKERKAKRQAGFRYMLLDD
jgi:excisionase family DNA binding protein